MFNGQGPGLSLHDLGETGGSDTVSLLESEMPAHSHALQASSHNANVGTPSANVALGRSAPATMYKTPTGNPLPAAMSDSALAPAGGDQPHNNLMPYLTLNFCIALQGVFPPRGPRPLRPEASGENRARRTPPHSASLSAACQARQGRSGR